MTAFIDEHRSKWGVEPSCRVLPIAPSTTTRPGSAPPSARTLRDDDLRFEIERVHHANLGVYGARKVWMQLNREGVEVARCTVERLMRQMNQGATRGGKHRTTVAAGDPAARPQDLVERAFAASAPNKLWVCDITNVRTWAGFVFVAYVIDCFARMPTELYGHRHAGCAEG